MDGFFPARDETVHPGTVDLNARIKGFDLSLPLLDRAEGIPSGEIFIEGPPFIGEGEVHGWVVLRPCGKEIDPIVNVRRRMNKIVETAVDPVMSKRFSCRVI